MLILPVAYERSNPRPPSWQQLRESLKRDQMHSLGDEWNIEHHTILKKASFELLSAQHPHRKATSGKNPANARHDQ